jgi:hypothetical protein
MDQVDTSLQSVVKAGLTAGRRSKRPRRDVETVGPRGFIPAAARFIRAAGRRAGEGDEFELAELAGLQAVLDEAIAAAVQGQKSYGKSWAHIGRALGISREAAWQRWGRP